MLYMGRCEHYHIIRFTLFFPLYIIHPLKIRLPLSESYPSLFLPMSRTPFDAHTHFARVQCTFPSKPTATFITPAIGVKFDFKVDEFQLQVLHGYCAWFHCITL